MAYIETCMENLLPAGAFMVGLVLDLGRQSPLVTAPTDGHLRALFLVLDPWGAGSYATSCPTNRSDLSYGAYIIGWQPPFIMMIFGSFADTGPYTGRGALPPRSSAAAALSEAGPGLEP